MNGRQEPTLANRRIRATNEERWVGKSGAVAVDTFKSLLVSCLPVLYRSLHVAV
jgi:hypothetical protein